MCSANLTGLPAELLNEIVFHLGYEDRVSLASTHRDLSTSMRAKLERQNSKFSRSWLQINIIGKLQPLSQHRRDTNYNKKPINR